MSPVDDRIVFAKNRNDDDVTYGERPISIGDWSTGTEHLCIYMYRYVYIHKYIKLKTTI